MEDMQRICTILCAALQETDVYNHNLLYLDLRTTKDGRQIVTVFLDGGNQYRIDVTGDSGTAMIRHIVGRLCP